MPFVAYCIDRPDAGDLRKRTRARHLEYMIEHKRSIIFGGPMRNDDDGATVGSIFALDCKARVEVKDFLAAEPYFIAGLFESVIIRQVAVMVPESDSGLLERELEREREAQM